MGSLLLICFLLYIFFPDLKQTKQEGVKAVAFVHEEQKENHAGSTTPEAKEQPKEDNEMIAIPIKEEIKEKVKEVVEGALDFFKKDQRIVSIGDSLTQGVGDETENGGYVGILNHTFEENNLNITIENFGKRGNRSDQLLKRLEKEKIAAAIKDADIVLVTVGANDIMKVVKKNFTNLNMEPFQQERLEYVKRLTAIFNKINEINPNTQIYLIGFYNPFERYFSDIEQLEMILDNWNNVGKSVTEEFDNAYYIPIEDLFSDSSIELLSDDYFHPNTTGYKLIAKRVLDYMNEFNELSEETEIITENIE